MTTQKICYLRASFPLFWVPISIASATDDTKIFPSPGEPVLTVSKMVCTTLSTSESSTTVDKFALAENSETYFPVPRPDWTTGFSPLPLPFPSVIVNPPTPISLAFRLILESFHYELSRQSASYFHLNI